MPDGMFEFVEDMDQKKEAEYRAAAINQQKESWDCCWGWPGPTPWGLCQFDGTCAKFETPRERDEDEYEMFGKEPQERTYAVMEHMRLIRQIDEHTWLAVCEHENLRTGYKSQLHGTRFVLDITEIWPPVYLYNSYGDYGMMIVSPVDKEIVAYWKKEAEEEAA